MNEKIHKCESVQRTLAGLLRTSDYRAGVQEFILPKLTPHACVQFLDTLLDIRALPEKED